MKYCRLNNDVAFCYEYVHQLYKTAEEQNSYLGFTKNTFNVKLLLNIRYINYHSPTLFLK